VQQRRVSPSTTTTCFTAYNNDVFHRVQQRRVSLVVVFN
ncbi:hypothetical protein LSAT2_005682, partial [Lamellibrachia satsuma]